MKILHTVEFYSPSVGGAQEVVKQVSEHLVKRGHEVTVATSKLPQRTSSSVNGVRIEEFDIAGNAVRGFKGETTRYQQFLLNNRFDVMMNYAAQQWATDLVFPILDHINCRKVLAPCGFSGLLNSKYKAYFDRLPAFLRQYDSLIFHSNTYRDIEFARKHDISHLTVIPNGALEEEFGHVDTIFRQRYGIPQGIPLLLTVGSHTRLKGHRLAIRSLLRTQLDRAILIIIGNTVGNYGCIPECRILARWAKLVSRGRKQVLLLNPPRQDVVAAYHAADLFVFGSNIECSPLVLFEAMASKTPFVTVGCGNAEEIANWGHGGIVLPTIRRSNGMVDAKPETMARAIDDLMMNPAKRQSLAESGHQAWRERFTWEKIAGRYEELYQSITDAN